MEIHKEPPLKKKKKILKLKNKISKIKNLLDVINSKLDNAEKNWTWRWIKRCYQNGSMTQKKKI